MVFLEKCARCERLRAEIVFARVRSGTRGFHLRLCPECDAMLLPISFSVAADPPSERGSAVSAIEWMPCECAAGGPVRLARAAGHRDGLLWVCDACGTGRWVPARA